MPDNGGDGPDKGPNINDDIGKYKAPNDKPGLNIPTMPPGVSKMV
jgi:hypothetical protein